MKKALSLFLALLLCVATFAALTLSVSAESAGYCAVGEVGSDKAAILLGDGSIVQASFTGTAPTADTVCTFTVDGDTYTFTPVTFAGYPGWRIYDVTGGSFFQGFDGDGTEYRAYYTNAVAFLKTGTNKWKVASSNQVVIPAGAGDGEHTGWWANIDAVDLDGDGALDIMYSDGSKLNDGLDPKVVLALDSAEYDVVLSGGSSQPEQPEQPASSGIVKGALCAVGEVDTSKQLAAVLFDNGKSATVKYTGTAPTSGAVHLYTAKGDAYSFTELNYEPTTTQWRVFDHLIDGADATDFVVNYDAQGNETRLYFRSDCVAFIKFTDTNWGFASGGQMINIRNKVQDYDYTVWPFNVYWSADTEEIVSMVSKVSSLFCDATASQEATAFFTDDQSQMTQGEFDLLIQEEDVVSPATGDLLLAVPAVALVVTGFGLAMIRRRKYQNG